MLRDIAPKAKAGRIDRARKLRRDMSLPEVLLWRELRKRSCGLKFRRQHPSGVYVLDFFCNDARLAIEIDGNAHDLGERPERDEVRDQWFATAGIATLRIPASDVQRDMDAVLAFICCEARARLPLHHPAAPGGPPPRDKLGED
jgi:very-short-patch-repair endonuclease